MATNIKPAAKDTEAMLVTTGSAKFATKIRRAVMDGMQNLVTGLGLQGRDKRVHNEFVWEPLGEIEAQNLYAADDVAQRVVDKLPEEMCREGVTFIGDNDDVEPFETRLKELRVMAKFCEAMQLSRLYGGAAVLIVVDDGKALFEPLGEVREIRALQVLHRYELYPGPLNQDLESEHWGCPEFWRVQTRDGKMLQDRTGEIHSSRLIRFIGSKLPGTMRSHAQHWGDSVLSRLVTPLKNYAAINDNAVSATEDLSVAVLKMKGLADLVSQGLDGETEVKRRLAMLQLSKSTLRMVLLDESETLEHATRSVAGFPEIMDRAEKRAVSATGMPHNIVLGDASGGMGSTGEAERLIWYDYVRSQQEQMLRPQLETVLELLAQEIGTEAPSFKFAALHQLTEKERAQLRSIQAGTDKTYVDAGVLLPDEVAESRFGSGDWAEDTQLDETARRSIEVDEENGITVPDVSGESNPNEPQPEPVFED